MLALLVCVEVSAKVLYKTTQADGTVIYSDSPIQGSVPVNLSAVNNVVMPALNNAASQKPLSSQNVIKQASQIQYQVTIISPLNEETLRNNAGDVTIKVNVTPKGAGKLQLIIDNQAVKTQTSPVFELKEINRGMHLIEIKLLNNSGKILASSQSQVFYLHKATALFNAN